MPENATEKRIVSPVISEATLKQRAASNPLVSSWVGASAGSGKTKVLTDRILRLLLPRENGEPATKPDKILGDHVHKGRRQRNGLASVRASFALGGNGR